MVTDKKSHIYNLLLERIVAGEFQPGDKLPTEREIAKEYKSSQWATHSAMNDLEDNGFVERRRAVGTFVKKNISLDKARLHKKSNSTEIWVSVSPDFYYSKLGNDTVLTSLEESLEADSYELTYIDMPSTRAKLQNIISKLEDGSIRALIIIPEYHEWKFMYNNVDLFTPVAKDIFYLNRGLGEVNVFPMNGITFNLLEESRMAVLYLIKKGYTNISYIGVNADRIYWLKERLKGFKNIVDNHSFGCSHQEFFVDKFGEREFLPVCEHIAASESKPAFVCCNDRVATNVIDYLKEKGYQAGDDYSIIAFDNHPEYRKYNLTTIAPPLNDVGPVIAKALLDRDNWRDLDMTHNYMLKSKLIERKTVIQAGKDA